MLKAKQAPSLITQTYLAYAVLMSVWIGAWISKTNVLDQEFTWLTTSLGSFVFWTVAKIFIWLLPAYWLIRQSGRTVKEVFNFPNWRRWLGWGGSIGLLIALTGFIPNFLSGQPIFPTELSIPLFSILAIAPLFEEFLLRGAIFGNLQRGYSMMVANAISAAMFVGLHIPGWYFMGTLLENMTKPVGGALSIFLLGLAFGYATYRGRSFMGGAVAHFLNNLS
jgi:membrane protease YdiL (CAAX protease family)